MNRTSSALFTLVGLIAGQVAATAAPSAIGLGGFSGSETVVNFNSLANEQLVTSQFAAQGVTFSGALYGMTNGGDTSLFPNSGGVIASNWLYSRNSHQGTSFTATFSSIMNRVGFYSETNLPDDTTITVVLGGNPQGSVAFATQLQTTFTGVEDLLGFNSVTVTVTGPDNNFIAIDDFRFEPVPEPSTGAMLGAGLLLGVARRRRQPGAKSRAFECLLANDG